MTTTTTDSDNLTRLKICTVEGPNHEIEAMFNPKEIQIDINLETVLSAG